MKEYVNKFANDDLRNTVVELQINEEKSNESELSNASDFHESDNEWKD